MGVDHPDLAFGPIAGVTKHAIELARELGLDGRNVFFKSGWVPYERIDDYLAEADASVCLGYENLESRFAFRTRYVDLFRARVPLLCTRGDVLADRVHTDRAGHHRAGAERRRGRSGIERILDDRAFVADREGEPGRHRRRTGLGPRGRAAAWNSAGDDDSFAMPAERRRLQAYTRGGMYFAMKKICKSPPLHA